MTLTDKINRMLAKGKPVKEIASKLNVSLSRVYQVRSLAKRKATPKFTSVAELRPQPQVVIDSVNHPPHYNDGGIETIDFIEAKGLNYRLGNVIKYVSRVDKKNSDPIEDLEKAAWYLQREITARKSA